MILNYKQIPYTTEFVEYPDLEPKMKALCVPAFFSSIVVGSTDFSCLTAASKPTSQAPAGPTTPPQQSACRTEKW